MRWGSWSCAQAACSRVVQQGQELGVVARRCREPTATDRDPGTFDPDQASPGRGTLAVKPGIVSGHSIYEGESQ